MRSRGSLRLAAALLALAALLPALPARAEVYLSREDALRVAFPDAEHVERRTLVLDDATARAVEERARAPLESRLVTLYVGRRGDAVLGYALIDVHTVRTLPEAFLVVVSPEGQVRSLRLLAFHEPPEYRPPDRWLGQFDRRGLDDELRLRRGIHGIAGATLSAEAVTRGVRRALALWSVLVDDPGAVARGTEPAATVPSGR